MGGQQDLGQYMWVLAGRAAGCCLWESPHTCSWCCWHVLLVRCSSCYVNACSAVVTCLTRCLHKAWAVAAVHIPPGKHYLSAFVEHHILS